MRLHRHPPLLAIGLVLAAPSADFFVSANRPRDDFGAAKRLVVAGRPTARAYLRFHPSQPLSPGASVTLRIYPLTDAPAGVLVRRASSRPWRERGTSYRRAPQVGSLAIASGRLRKHRWRSIDISAVASTRGDVSLALTAAGLRPVAIASRESGSTAPRLIVDQPQLLPEPGLGPPGIRPPPGSPPGRPVVVPAPGAAPSAATPCGVAAAPPAWQHVVWIVFENKNYMDIVGAPDAPYMNAVAAQCGLATNFFAEAHPSLPNYIAMTSGSTQGVTGDRSPDEIVPPLAAPSIFSQLGSDWRALMESMPTNCAASSAGEYAVNHNPAVYYADIAGACALQDVPLTDPPDLSARFTFVMPNKCSAMHDCSVATGDTWLSLFLPKVLDSPEYRSGTTAVFITFDESHGGGGQHIATFIVSPSTPVGAQDATPYSHYSLLRTTEEMLGLPLLGNAAIAPSKRVAFNL
ncbi:MAG TPA: alkaline phosphatase family protein [Solirubrobacteraceae bacterium]|jgi:hypothetical protein